MADLFARLPEPLRGAVRARAAEWHRQDGTRRLWDRDPSLWTGTDEGAWLGWLDAVATTRAALAGYEALASAAAREGVRHVLLLGMGGSSLCPYVLATTFEPVPGRPVLHVLDSTDPAQIAAAESAVDLATTWFVVSSKSGSTLEPNILCDYFQDRVRASLGPDAVGPRFVAITDPGSALERRARTEGFRAVLPGVPSVGGRFSALTAFGMAPAALQGLDVARVLDRAAAMAERCGPAAAPADNPGVALGLILGACARSGLDKLTFVAAPGVRELGAWLEQLIAESTGKRGRAIIPVDREELIAPLRYGDDRLFVHLGLAAEPDGPQEAALRALEQAGRPLVRLVLEDRYDLGAEFFRWEVATAVAGAIMGINAFDQPDVEAAKIEARRLTDEVEARGALPPEAPFAEDRGIRLFADPANATALAGSPRSLEGLLRAHLARLGAGDYFALQAWVPRNADHERALQQLRQAVLRSRGNATTLGFGPRFLHSTGQAHKGGPNTGVFLQVTCDDAQDLPVPGHRYSFGTVKAAQARGDFAVLVQRGRRVLRAHLPAGVADGLRRLVEATQRALA